MRMKAGKEISKEAWQEVREELGNYSTVAISKRQIDKFVRTARTLLNDWTPGPPPRTKKEILKSYDKVHSYLRKVVTESKDRLPTICVRSINVHHVTAVTGGTDPGAYLNPADFIKTLENWLAAVDASRRAMARRDEERKQDAILTFKGRRPEVARARIIHVLALSLRTIGVTPRSNGTLLPLIFRIIWKDLGGPSISDYRYVVKSVLTESQ